MAKNVVINGVTYQNVPQVDIPISGGGTAEFYDTSDATLASGDSMLSGVTAYADGTKYTGTIATKASSDLTASGATVTAPAGYYATAASKAIASGTAKTPATTISGIIADEMAIGMVNNKTTAVRLIPAPGKKAGDRVVFGGLLGEAPIIAVNPFSCADFINRGGRIPAPIHSFRN